MNLKLLKIKATVFVMLLFFAVNLFAFNSIKNNFEFIDVEVMHPELFSKNVSSLDANAYHLFTHGRSGELLINGEWKNAKEIANFLNSAFNHHNSTFTTLNIYGCEFAKGKKGLAAVSYLEKALALKVNASTNITGKDGDWVLEIGNIKINNFKSYSYNLQCENQGTETSQDYDCDGKINGEDFDDDNDGVLDSDECSIISESLTGGNIDEPTDFAVKNGNATSLSYPTSPTNQNGSITYSNIRSVQSTASGFRTIFFNNNQNTSETSRGRVRLLNHLEEQTVNTTKKVEESYYKISGVGTTNVWEFDVKVYKTIASSFGGNLISDPSELLIISESGGLVEYISSNATTGLRYRISGGVTAFTIKSRDASLLGELDFNLLSNLNSGEYTSFQAIRKLNCDTDSDGIINALDLDSDGDGCPDAVEGGGNYSATNLVDSSIDGGSTNVIQNFASSTVDGDGVPNSGTSQTVGDSQTYGTDTICCQDASNYTYFTDNDGDNIGNECDLDDDNDGILDSEECSGAYVSSFEGWDNDGWTTSSAGDAAISTDNVSNGIIAKTFTNFEGLSTIDFTIDVVSNNASSSPSTASTASLALKIDGVEYVLWENTDATATSYPIPGELTISSGALVSPGTFVVDNMYHTYTISIPWDPTDDEADFEFVFNSASDDFKMDNFTLIGDSAYTRCDTDNDGIQDGLDLDSDGDGCPDAVEGGGTYTAANLVDSSIDGGSTNVIQNFASSTVDGDGVPNSGTSQTVGDSQTYGTDTICCQDASNYTYFTDTDGDNIGDDCDLDDDNDGILDVVEKSLCGSSGILSDSGWKGRLYDAPNQNSWALINSSTTFPSQFVQIATFDYNKFKLTDRAFDVQITTEPYAVSTHTDVENFEGANVPNDGSTDSAIKFSKVLTDLEEGVYRFDLGYGDDHIVIYHNGVKQYALQNAFGTTTNNSMPSITNVLTLALNAGDTLEYVVVEAAVGNTAIDLYAVKTFEIDGVSPPRCISDTDNDSILNHLDLDSDGDGCPDAVEGGGTYTATNLVDSSIDGGSTNVIQNFASSTVDGDGVPNSGTSQTVGDSQTYGTDTICCQDASNYTYFTDNDGDNIGDDCDLDDDNDGILDSEECSSEYVSSFNDWTREGGWTISSDGLGMRNQEHSGLHHDFASKVFQGFEGLNVLELSVKVRSNNTSNSSTAVGTGFLELEIDGVTYVHWQNTANTAPSHPVSGELTASSGASISPSNFDVYTTSGPFTEYTITIPWDPTDDVANISFLFDAIDDDFDIREFKLLGSSAYTRCDTDNDGIQDGLDLDSDGDGCPDAVEGGGAYTAIDLVNSSIDGGSTNVIQNFASSTVDGDGVPNSGTSQTVGDSQTYGTDTICCQDASNYTYFTDTDGDNIGNDCDLDDDNDGILDAVECSSEYVSSFNDWTRDGGWTISSDGLGMRNQLHSGLHHDFATKVFQGFEGLNVLELSVKVRSNNTSNLSTAVGTGFLELEIDGVTYVHWQNTANTAPSHPVSGELTASSGASISPSNFDVYTTSGPFTEYIITIPWDPTDDVANISFLFDAIDDDFDIREFKLVGSTAYTRCDTDNDGIPNGLDLDSDADGCPDAVEGSGNYSSINLADSTLDGGSTNVVQNFPSSTVDADGVPNSGTTQTVGDSQTYGTDTICCQDASNYTYFADTDGDNLGNTCDLDDDNDGILDSEECSSEYVSSFNDWTREGGWTISSDGLGMRNQVHTGLHHDFASKVFQGFEGLNVLELSVKVRSNNTANSSTTVGTGFLELEIDGVTYVHWQNTANTAPSHPVSGELTASSGASISPSNFDVYTTSGPFTEYTITIPWDPTDDVANISFLFDAIDDDFDIREFKLLGSTAYTQCDTDGDGIPNGLDLDSDADGCPDALEGNAGLTYNNLNTDSSINASVNDNGIPVETGVGSPGSGTTGQSDVSSQDPTIQSNECDSCNSTSTLFVDTDGDTIGNDCDLDDDNDGILDTVEKEQCGSGNADSGTGVNRDTAYFLNWDGADFIDDTVDVGDSQTFTLPNGDTVTATVTAAVTASSTSGVTLRDMEIWSGARFYRLYNTPGSKEALRGSGDMEVVLSFTGTKPDGTSFLPDLLVADSEATDDGLETLNFITNGSNWTLFEEEAGAAYNGIGTSNVEMTQTFNGVPFIRSNNVSNLTVKSDTDVAQAFTVAIHFECNDLDTDNDGIPNRLDLDSDGDGCPDALEGTGSFSITQLVSSNIPGGNADTGDGTYNGTSPDPVIDNLGNTTVDADSTSATYGVPTVEDTDNNSSPQGIGSSQDVTISSCPNCILPILTLGTTSCDGTTYSVNYSSTGEVTVTDALGVSITGVFVGTNIITGIPLDTDVIVTSTNGDCTISTSVTGLDDPCDPDCNLPGLVLGQPICGATGNYMVSYTIEDSSATVTITGGTDPSNTGVATAPLGTAIVISVMNSCATESMTVNSDDLDCVIFPCSNPGISISGIECATDGDEFYMISFASATGTTVTVLDVATGLPVGNVNTTAGTITNIPSGKNVSVTATLEDCTEGQTIEITAPDCPECILPQLTVGTTSCDGTTYSVGYNSNADVSVTDTSGASITGVLVGTGTVTNIPIGTDVILTATNGDCTISTNVTSLDDPCDPDCDLPGLVLGQPICGATGNYMVSYTIEDSSATVTITGGTDPSNTGVATAPLGTAIVISVMNSCGTESMSVNSTGLNCADAPCNNPAISISGTECATDGGEFYMISFASASGTTVTVLDVATGLPVGNVNTTAGTITNLPSGKNVSITATLEDCTEGQTIEITAPDCPECLLPQLTVGTTSCDGTTYSVGYNSNADVSVTDASGASITGVLVGTDSVSNIPVGTDVILTATNGDCTISTNVTSLDDPCDPDCDLPGLVLGQPICGATGNYMVSYTIEDSSATVTITGGTDPSNTGVATAPLGTAIVISVTNACGTESMSVNSTGLNCTDAPCNNPAISISGTECENDGTYTINFTVASGTSVTTTSGDIDTAAGTVSNIPNANNVTLTATIGVCVTSQSIEVAAPSCPKMSLEKSATYEDTDGNGVVNAGDTINYNFTITNTGNVALTNVTVSDPLLVAPNGSITGVPIAILAVGANDSSTFTGSYTIQQSDIDAGSFTNSATVSGEAPDGSTVNDTSDDPNNTDNTDGNGDGDPDDATVTDLSSPMLSVEKVGTYVDTNSNGVVDVNDTINYTFTVENTGNLDITGITINDPLLVAPNGSMAGGPIDLIVGADDTTTFTGSYMITAADIANGGVENSATASGTASNGVTVEDTSDDPNNNENTDNNNDGDPDDITVTDLTNPMMSLEKEATYVDTDGNGIVNAGDTINYNFTITNTGNVALTNVTVSDPLLVAPNGSITGGPIAILAVGANDTATFTGSYTIQQSDIDAGSFTNSATVSGEAPDGSTVNDTSDDPNNTDNTDGNGDGDPDDATVTDLSSPMLSVEKVGTYVDTDANGVVSVGDTINYTFTVTNTGNIDITGITISDPLLVAPNGSMAGGPIDLIVGADDTTTFTGSYMITADDIANGGVENSATASGTASNGVTVEDTSDDPNNNENTDNNNDGDPDDITVTDLTNPMMSLEKEATYVDTDANGIVNAGDTINYNFTITNTGNVALTNVTVSDPLLVAPNGSITGGPIAILAVGANDTATFTGSYTIQQSDIDAGSFTNSATVSGEAPDGSTVNDTSDDPNNTDNTDGNGDGDPDDATVTDLSSPMLSVEKVGTYVDTDANGVVSVGDTINYTFTVENTGNLDITGITINDPLLVAPNGSMAGGPIDLIVGADDTTTFTGSYMITAADIANGGVENSATASGTASNGVTVEDTSDDPNNNENTDNNNDGDPDDITVTDLTNPMMSLEKEATYVDTDGNGIVNAGDTINYNFTITNTGNVALTNVTVSDPLLVAPNGSITGGPIAILAVGANDTATFTGSYTIQQSDVDAGSFTNSATVSGTAPDGSTIEDTSDDPNNTDNTDGNGDGDPDDATVTDLSSPMLSVEKVGTYVDTDANGVVSVGDTINYTFTVTNTGNLDITGITISDPLLVAPNGSMAGGPIDLAVGADDTTTFTGSYMITADDIANGGVENSATASGTASNGVTVEDTSDDPNNNENTDNNNDGDPDDITVTDLTNPMMSLEKEATYVDTDANGIVNAGDTINYNFTITNTGNVALTNVTVSDPLLVAPNGSITGVPIAILAVGANDSSTFTGSYTIQQSDIDAGSFTNSATVSGEAPDGSTVNDTSDDPTDGDTTDNNGDGDPDGPTVLDLSSPMLSVEKVGTYVDTNSNGVVDVNDTINYTFTVTNTGNLDITGITISDPLLVAPNGSMAGGPIDLAVGADDATTFTGSYMITADDIANGSVENSATASGTASNGVTVEDTSDDPNNNENTDNNNDGNPDDITVTDLTNPMMSLEKEATYVDTDANGIVNAGDTINYNFTITNTGNVALTNVTVSDPLLVAPNGSITGGPIAILAVGANDTATFTGSYTIQQSDIDAGSFTNSATVSGEAPDGSTVNDTSDDPNNTDNTDGNGDGDPDDATVTDLSSPMLSVEKVGTYVDTDANGVVSVGDTINYTFTVTNTGNIDITGITISDPLLVAPNGSMAGGPIDLIVGADDTTTFTGSYMITADDIANGGVENSATASGTASNGVTVEDTSDDPNNNENTDNNNDGDPDDITVTDLTNPMMSLEKEATYVDTDANGIVNAGDTINYNFTITNTGNVALTNVTVSDPLLVAPNGSITGGPIAILAVGANDTATFTGSYTIQQSDIDAGSFTNSATVSGEAPDGSTVNDTSDDPNNTDNTDGNGDGDPDDATVTDLSSPMLSVEKVGTYVDTDANGVVSVGDTINYTFTVENTGNLDITGITINDPLLVAPNGSMAGGPIDLIVGADDTTTFTGSYMITAADIANGGVENSATASGTASNGVTVEDTSDDPNNNENTDNNNDGDPDDITVTDLTNPMMSLEKEATYVDTDGNGIVNAGDTINYNFTITNTGNVALTNVTVSDPLLVAPNGSITGGPIAILAVGANDTATFTGSYTIQQSDVDAGSFTNSATVSGTAPDGSTIEDTSDDPTDGDTTDNNGDGDPDGPTVLDLSSPMLSVEKVGTYVDTNSNGVVDVNDTINYTFTVTNTGNLDITGITISDPLLVAPNGSMAGGPIDLAVGADDATTFTGSYMITADDIANGSVENSATASGTASNGVTVEDTSDDPNNNENTDNNNDGDPDDITVTDLTNPMMSLEKEATYVDTDANGVVNAGDTINYNFTITNTGNVALTNVTVSDPLLVAPNGSMTGGPIAILAVGANDTSTFTGSYTIQQSDVDAGSFTNSATVSGEAPDGSTVNDTSDDPTDGDTTDNNGDGDPDGPTVTDLSSPMLGLEKVASFVDTDANGIVNAGDMINYSFTVTNTGNIDITGITISDPLLVAPNGSITGGPIDLIVGADDTTTFTGSYTITAADITNGSIENSATVSGIASNGVTVEDTSDDPSDSTNVDANGDGEPDDVTVFIVPPYNDIELTKTIADGNMTPLIGSNITFVIAVTNNGPSPATGVEVLDLLPSGYTYVNHTASSGVYASGTGMWTNLDDLPVGTSQTLTVIATVLSSGDYNNIAEVMTADEQDTDSVHGNGILSEDDMDSVEPTPVAELANLSITKAVLGGDLAAEPGDEITFVITVNNAGPNDATGVSVQELLPSGFQYIDSDTASGSYDPTTGLWSNLDTIPVNTSVQLTVDVLVLDSGDYTNYVQIMTSDQADPNSTPGDNSTGADDDDVVSIEVGQLYVIKTGEFADENGDDYATVGEAVTYEIEVHNDGDIALSSVMLTDANADAGSVTYVSGDDNTNDILDIGEVWYYTAVHTITQADIDAGSVTNTAIASGVTPGGTTVIDESDDASPFEDDATVTVLPTCGENLIVHNVITPNDGDQVNDVFVIANIACAPDNTVQIFNRWGVLVYETENYGSNGNYFNGTSEGRVNIQNKELPVGTYYYVIDYVSPSGANKSAAGYLYIQR